MSVAEAETMTTIRRLIRDVRAIYGREWHDVSILDLASRCFYAGRGIVPHPIDSAPKDGRILAWALDSDDGWTFVRWCDDEDHGSDLVCWRDDEGRCRDLLAWLPTPPER